MGPSCMLPSSSDELTGLFLGAVASPQRRPPLHPVRSTYKQPDAAQVFLPAIRHNISFTPLHTPPATSERRGNQLMSDELTDKEIDESMEQEYRARLESSKNTASNRSRELFRKGIN